MKIVVGGGPRTGKTTFAHKLGVELKLPVKHTDDLIPILDWSGASQAVSEWFQRSEPCIIEGVAVWRALRKWLASHAVGKPCDTVYVLNTPMVDLSPGQDTMSKGCDTVWRQIEPELRERGVVIKEVFA